MHDPGGETELTELVGVHGIGQHHRGRHQLLASWRPALADGLERAAGLRLAPPPLDLAFYGDVFLPAGGGAPTKSADPQRVFDDLDGAELAAVSDALSEAVTAADVAAAESAGPKGYTRVPRPVQVLLRAVDRRFGAAAGVLYVGVLRQVHRYLTDADLRARVHARVDGAIDDGCRVLIGHSLGSVVCYEHLRRHPDRGVALLVTLGSPLGLRMVRRHLPVHPLGVRAWVNVRDARDPVACAGRLHRWWPQIGDTGDVVVDNGSDAHAAERYLCHRSTGEVLLGALPHLAAR
jgi:hypothetical protein